MNEFRNKFGICGPGCPMGYENATKLSLVNKLKWGSCPNRSLLEGVITRHLRRVMKRDVLLIS